LSLILIQIVALQTSRRFGAGTADLQLRKWSARARGGFLAYHALQIQRKIGFCGALSETIMKGTRVVAMPITVIAPVEALPRFVVYNEFKWLSARTASGPRRRRGAPQPSETVVHVSSQNSYRTGRAVR
jgi:hypothetical protein